MLNTYGDFQHFSICLFKKSLIAECLHISFWQHVQWIPLFILLDSCEYANEPLSSIKDREFID
jgi:hypothetical protein